MKKTGILLINLGSPDEPTPEAVGRYLREFLMDEKVIDIPAPLRWLLVRAAIVPRRKHRSAELYRSIWSDSGSPLIAHTRALADQLQLLLPDRFVIEIGMRYGKPSIAGALARLVAAEVESIVAMPLYPQYAESSYQTAVLAVRQAASNLGCTGLVRLFPVFYDRAEFINAWVVRLKEHLLDHSPDHIIFSYHSLPVRHLKRLDSTGQHCLARSGCCERISDVNQNCYRAQCLATTREIARELDLNPEGYTPAFQSRLGRAQWLGPQTEDVLRDLARRGVRQVSVSCPSFTADCLETLEEIGRRARRVFLEAGGAQLNLVPSLNAHPVWVKSLAEWIESFE